MRGVVKRTEGMSKGRRGPLQWQTRSEGVPFAVVGRAELDAWEWLGDDLDVLLDDELDGLNENGPLSSTPWLRG